MSTSKVEFHTLLKAPALYALASVRLAKVDFEARRFASCFARLKADSLRIRLMCPQLFDVLEQTEAPAWATVNKPMRAQMHILKDSAKSEDAWPSTCLGSAQLSAADVAVVQ